MARGGKRRGRVGQQYANRSDLRGPGTPDIPKTMQGQPYGTAKQQAAVQAAGPGSPGGPGAAPPGAPPGSPGAGGSGPAPGSLGAFNRPTERPNEPFTAGLDRGPGPGSEALQMFPEQSEADMRDMLIYLPMLEHLASRPDSSMTTRNFVRRLRGAIPATEGE